jgi:hypothetical protein
LSAGARVLNFLLFQAAWFACVLGAAHGRELLGPACVGAWAALHVARGPRRARTAGALAAVALLGTTLDSLFVATRLLDYAGTPLLGRLAPAWIISLWVALALTFRSSLAWLAGRPRLAVLLGALAPISYLAGERLGALSLGNPRAIALPALALAWSVTLPLALRVQARIHGPPCTDRVCPHASALYRPGPRRR